MSEAITIAHASAFFMASQLLADQSGYSRADKSASGPSPKTEKARLTDTPVSNAFDSSLPYLIGQTRWCL
jgi:hypothetical protein